MDSETRSEMEAGTMVVFLLLIIPVAVVILLMVNKIYIDWKSIVAKTIALDTGIFGVYCFTGKQGSGKTYSLTKYVKKYLNEDTKVYSNLTIHGLEYENITSIEHLLSLRNEKNLFIIFDEIFTLLADKTIPKDIREELMEFLSQQRKMKNILFTTAQEWLNIPIDFRRFVRIQIECRTRPLGRWGGILMEEYNDAYEMKWSNDDNEYVAPRIRKKYSKYEKRYMESYNTYERIRRLKRNDADRSTVAPIGANVRASRRSINTM